MEGWFICHKILYTKWTFLFFITNSYYIDDKNKTKNSEIKAGWKTSKNECQLKIGTWTKKEFLHQNAFFLIYNMYGLLLLRCSTHLYTALIKFKWSTIQHMYKKEGIFYDIKFYHAHNNERIKCLGRIRGFQRRTGNELWDASPVEIKSCFNSYTTITFIKRAYKFITACCCAVLDLSNRIHL